ncbi:unnamed protein product (macronuclear) [Paramecium tetraurelia]|uniref:C3H1-type domain-containing protein n=1 Tax=Paramecium tetraurelia TaxID=5888 RepID=A0C6S3_PARTE|nr:uncharacterized protein GSPATT00035619001 [Paramecium tetraurelia]CAK66490.1 unnamed protein product [Paramecium tetraurelia]|eukprot:XP_001433887.1 hypothetical protein (macronuclear) [Paramecium tetraurelia strain d4-2]
MYDVLKFQLVSNINQRMKNQTNQSEICQYCNLSDCECSDQEDWDSCDSPKPKTLYSFKEINLQNKSLLAEIRIICKNLIYVIGLAPNIAKEDVISFQLKKPEYFGQYGQIQKLIVIQSNTFNPPSHAAYITYRNEQEASLAILVNIINIYLQVKASFGTTKYCTNFLKGQQCKIKDCVYLHQHPKDKDSTQVLKKEEMNNSKWLFSYSQKLAQTNFKKFYTSINYKNALQKSIFPTTQNILDHMIKERIVEPLQQQQSLNIQQEEVKEIQQIQDLQQPIYQKPIDIEKRVEAVILQMDGDGNTNSRFKFTNSKIIPQDHEAIQQIKQYLQK